MPTGKIRFYNEERGFGFIAQYDPGGLDVFFHVTSLGDSENREPAEGDHVEFEIGTDARNGKTKAVNVRLIAEAETPA